jgi:hypothetical protein
MESTGVLWIPAWNVLEGDYKLLLTNAQHLKKVPGRKKDVTDAEWIAQLMQCGLLKPSFVPNREARHWRTLTRQRMKLIDQHTGMVNRPHMVLQQGNIKLSSVATDALGVSGGASDPETIASLAKGRLKSKHEQLVESLSPVFTALQGTPIPTITINIVKSLWLSFIVKPLHTFSAVLPTGFLKLHI